MYHERCQLCGSRWQRVPLTISTQASEIPRNSRTAFTSTGERPVEIERSFLPSRSPEHGDAGHATVFVENAWRAGRLQGRPGRVRCAPGGRDSVPLNAHGLLERVDQHVYAQMTCKTGQRPEGQIAALGLSPGTKDRSGRTSDGVFSGR